MYGILVVQLFAANIEPLKGPNTMLSSTAQSSASIFERPTGLLGAISHAHVAGMGSDQFPGRKKAFVPNPETRSFLSPSTKDAELARAKEAAAVAVQFIQPKGLRLT